MAKGIIIKEIFLRDGEHQLVTLEKSFPKIVEILKGIMGTDEVQGRVANSRESKKVKLSLKELIWLAASLGISRNPYEEAIDCITVEKIKTHRFLIVLSYGDMVICRAEVEPVPSKNEAVKAEVCV